MKHVNQAHRIINRHAGLRLTLHFAGPRPCTLHGPARIEKDRGKPAQVVVSTAPCYSLKRPLYFLAAITDKKTGHTLMGRYCWACRKALAPSCTLCPGCGSPIEQATGVNSH